MKLYSVAPAGQASSCTVFVSPPVYPCSRDLWTERKYCLASQNILYTKIASSS